MRLPYLHFLVEGRFSECQLCLGDCLSQSSLPASRKPGLRGEATTMGAAIPVKAVLFHGEAATMGAAIPVKAVLF